MDLAKLIEHLSRPTAFPTQVERVDVVHTHISVVFLAGGDVFKIKKPVDLDFLDFSTLAKRKHFCEEEVRLNRRLAPHVYKGVVPVTRHGDGLRFGGEGEAVEWAVHMERLSDADQLCQRIERGAATMADMHRLARRLADFHAIAASGPEISRQANFEGVTRNVLDALIIPDSQVGVTVSRAVHERLQTLTKAALAHHRDIIESRSARGVPRDCHGDLHLDHVYLFPDRPPPDDLIAVDCIEFNERFRFIDPVADMCFAYMDLLLLDRDDLARALREAYFAARPDAEGETLVPLYTSYRASVRGKVEGLKMEEAEVPPEAQQRAKEESIRHWQLALAALEAPSRRPGLILVGGLPGTGKSTLSRGLAEETGFDVIRSDVVRKKLAHAAGVLDTPADFGAGIYTADWTDRTYTSCLTTARHALFDGHRILIDATFQAEGWRQAFLDAARHAGVPAVFLQCTAAPHVVQARLHARTNDVSDADWAIYQKKAEAWDPPGELTRRCQHEIATDQGDGVIRAVAVLKERGLA
jgi:aminoglycoside phosphotransferase family enzyme/predicted kinase